MGKRKNAPVADEGGVEVKITPPKMQVALFRIRGDVPHVGHKFSAKAQAIMQEAQEQGQAGRIGKARQAKNFKECFEAATYRMPDGSSGIPATGFRLAMISACRLTGMAMTKTKQTVFIVADGYDADDGTPLVKITKGKPHMNISPVRNASGVCDLRARPMWDPGWEATVRVKFDAGQLTLSDVANLLNRAGIQVGVGEGRPGSKSSGGKGWGTFEVLPG